MMNIKTLIKEILIYRLLVSILIGALAGYLYYYFIGCNSGTCPITSNPYISILYGALFGIILGFKRKKKAKEDQE